MLRKGQRRFAYMTLVTLTPHPPPPGCNEGKFVVGMPCVRLKFDKTQSHVRF